MTKLDMPTYVFLGILAVIFIGISIFVENSTIVWIGGILIIGAAILWETGDW